MPKFQPIFRTAAKHTVGLFSSLGYEIVNQNTDVSLISAEHEGWAILNTQGCVSAGNQSLRRGLLVTGSAIDLPGKIKMTILFGFQSVRELGRREKVVFYCVSRPHYLRVFQSRNRPDKLKLDLVWKAG